ncbi:MAG: DUF1570 domain-containing protein [Planctomycetes bacterium]|nr:DUF1570 domain-containing protein [Planctomycetota bacterium]
MLRVLLLALTLHLALGPLAPAQDAPPDAAPPQAEPEAPARKVEEKGPNLHAPPWFSPAQREQLEAATRVWEDAFEAYKKEGAAAARPKVDQAIVTLTEARKVDPRCGIPDHYLGIAYQLTGEFDKAIERLRDAVRKNSRFHEAMVELGDAYRWASKLDDAMRSYDQAIATQPDYALAYKMRALLRVQKDQLAQARQDAARAKELDPADPEVAAIETRLALVLEGPPWENKFTCETRHYIVWTNADQAMADEIGRHAELIRKLYEKIFPRPPRAKRKFPIVVFATREEYHRNGGPPGAGGHFDPAFKQLFLFRYEKMSDTLLVLYHEGFHQFLDSILDVHAPQWFNEGLADFFGPSEYYKERNDEGMRIKTNPWRLRTVQTLIRQDRATDFEKLMTMSQQEMYEPRAAGNHYAQAWSMVYFLAQADDGAYFGYLRDYFQALRRGKNIREAYQAAFGKADMAAMQARWREYVLQLR